MQIDIAPATAARPHHIVMLIEPTRLHFRRCATAADAAFVRRQWLDGKHYLFPATDHLEFAPCVPPSL